MPFIIHCLRIWISSFILLLDFKNETCIKLALYGISLGSKHVQKNDQSMCIHIKLSSELCVRVQFIVKWWCQNIGCLVQLLFHVWTCWEAGWRDTERSCICWRSGSKTMAGLWLSFHKYLLATGWNIWWLPLNEGIYHFQFPRFRLTRDAEHFNFVFEYILFDWGNSGAFYIH